MIIVVESTCDTSDCSYFLFSILHHKTLIKETCATRHPTEQEVIS